MTIAGQCLQVRYLLSALCFFAAVNVYLSRNNMSISIVSMVNHTHQNHLKMEKQKNEISDKEPFVNPCLDSNSTGFSKKVQEDGPFQWDHGSQTLLLASYFYGYTAFQIFGGYATYVFGFHKVMGVSIGLSAILNILIPFVLNNLEHGLATAVALRIMIGCVHAPIFPALQGVWTTWAPLDELTRSITTSYMGAPAGSFMILYIGGKLGSYFGWESIFYFSTTCNIIWAVIWFLCIRNAPEIHPFISEEEKHHIMKNRTTAQKKLKFDAPFKQILTSVPFWSIVMAQWTLLWAFYTIAILLPKYLHDVQGYNSEKGGTIAAISMLAQACTTLAVGKVADVLKTKGFPLVWIRKGFALVGSIIPCICLFCMLVVGCNPYNIVILQCFMQSFLSFQMAGAKSNINDIAPQYASILMGMSNTIGSMPGFVSPNLAGYLLKKYDIITGWNYVFAIAAAFVGFGGIFFAIFGKAELQEWSQGKQDEEIKRLKSDTSA